MINVKALFDLLKENNVNCFCGVPDSLLKDFCAYITDNTTDKEHTITANEGNAIGLAAGHFLATGNPALVYMQNSGIGNCVNPLLSLTDEEVYNIPLMMFIGWRGEPDKKDEPQHIKQGKVTGKLLDAMGIKYSVMEEDFEKTKIQMQNAFQYMRETNCPYAFIIKKGTFEKYSLINKKQSPYSLKREVSIETVIKNLNESDVIVSTTGHISREVYETRERLGQSHKQDFLTVGSMGHSSSIALGIALQKPDRTIYCFDGDGSILMHQGSITVNATKELKNFKHIVFNNEAHDSVGSQPTAMYKENLSKVALDCGYKKAYSVSDKEELLKILPEFINDNCTALLEIKVKCGAREDLGRPKEKPWENKKIFTENLNQIEFCYKGSAENISKILEIENAKKILVFTGRKSYEKIKPLIEKELNGCEITYYNDFSTNPKKEEIDIAVKNLKLDFDIIFAIGGGSVIDFAKGFRYYLKTAKKLVAVPTTAGTGSESTQFAVIYFNGVKKSLDEKSILPNYLIVDSQFVKKNPKYLKACTAMDAFCHAIESYWSVKSTPLSRKYAKKAIILCKENLINYVNSENDDYADNMMKAANFAGKAINISRTTAAHALSYTITSKYNLPHGHAVALSMGDLFSANLKIDETTCIDKRGVEFVRQRMSEIFELLNIVDFKNYWNDLMDKIGLETDFKKLNIKDKTEIINSVNLERLKNNPKRLDNDLADFYKEFQLQ
ncbi:phosphonopyruvate decarboxylase [bacterium]|nr:phosphonopyruvate decarboxylase [bacterium]